MIQIPEERKEQYRRWKEDLQKQITGEESKFPKGFVKWWGTVGTNDTRDAIHEEWFLQRFTCLFDHVFLSGFVQSKGTMEPILGMDFQDDPHSLLFSKFLPKQPGVYITLPNPTPVRGEDDPAFIEVPIPLSDLDKDIKKRMILWPRGLFKTSAAIVEMVQCILNYPNIRICFLTGSHELAISQCIRIKDIFEKPTKRFKLLFPEFCTKSVLNPKNNTWEDMPCKMGNKHRFTVPARTARNLAQPTFTISTAKTTKAGAHYDLIFVDDLVNEQNYRSVKLLEKCWEDYKAICPTLDPSGFMILTGTRYSFGDTYQRIQDLSKDEEKKLGKTIWSFSIEDCWSEGRCIRCGHSEPWHNKFINPVEAPCQHVDCHCPGFESDGIKGVLFPETRTFDGRPIGHTMEFLEGERLRLGPEFFANQYENSPMAEGAQTFTDALISAQTIFDLKLVPTYLQGYTFAVADLAYVGQEGRDYSVIYLCRLYQGQIFVYDCLYGNWDSSAVAENIVRVLLLHRPAIIYPEKFNGWEAYDTVIASLAAVRGIPKVPIMWLKGSQAAKAKLTRIGAVKGVLASKRMWLFAGMPGYETLVEQLSKWPKLGRHDDFADCLGQVAAAPTGYQLENPPVVESATNWLRKLGEAKPLDDSYGDSGGGTGLACGPSMN